MQRHKTVANMKNMSLQTFQLPDHFNQRLQELEIDLYEGKLNSETLKELFELYTVYII